ncbi:AEC family transporter [Leptotrichia buccalis]|uniref:Auxin Efflux Carrier n=1 Tax=Leptotrichia buccalis (strain ATCC 14201 / DSM 1135 / JCM 12969 / NCTC 10249 / C-1013-b) TaxID=523794 RepID=C7NC16_LEPBD|nr:AEC family transporter [Leptotrichia buccalis]ACV39697.1 Auxin Efflux Carrier [Leptotrichia buccalis C-1013-b]
MIFLKSLGSIFPIIVMISIGYILKKRHWFHHTFSENVSKLITNVALPCSIFYSVLKYLNMEALKEVSNRLIFTFASVIIGYVAAFFVIKLVKMREGRRGVFYNAVVNANTIFIGLPLNMALFGEAASKYYLMYYITNTVSIWTLGYMLLASDPMENSGDAKGGFDLKKLLSPPLIAFVIAFAVLLSGIRVITPIVETTKYLGSVVTPLALLYIGIVLADAGLHSIRFDLDTNLALLGRFVFSSVVMIVLLKIAGRFVKLDPLEIKTFVIQAAAPVFAALPILTNETKGDIGYSTNVVTTSTILFILVVPLLMSILNIIHI